jgi:hypothetical protein
MVITNAPAEPHADNPALQRLCGQPAPVEATMALPN